MVWAQESITVHVTVTEPPQKSGPLAGASLDMEALHPPEKVASPSCTQAAKAASTWACVRHSATVVSGGQVMVGGVGGGTVNVALHVMVWAQESITVHSYNFV